MISIDDFGKLDLRVAEIIAAKEHPDADRLLVLDIKVGEEERTIVAGIRGHYEPEALIGRQIVVVANLEPCTLRGIESNGMLLAARDGERVVLLTPESAVEPGSSVG